MRKRTIFWAAAVRAVVGVAAELTEHRSSMDRCQPPASR
jgi:hypothetical protein